MSIRLQNFVSSFHPLSSCVAEFNLLMSEQLLLLLVVVLMLCWLLMPLIAYRSSLLTAALGGSRDLGR